MKVRIVYKPDKSVSIIHPAPKSRKPDETEKQWLKRVFDKAMQGELKELPYDDIDDSYLPQDREDRMAWEGEKGKGVTINQIKAKELKDAQEKAELITAEKDRLLEEMAIANLQAQGKI